MPRKRGHAEQVGEGHGADKLKGEALTPQEQERAEPDEAPELREEGSAVRPREAKPTVRGTPLGFDFERAFLWLWGLALVIVCLIGIIRALEAVR
jgi:hypothetical protein